MELNNKVAIAIGASSGIGEAIARDLRQAGMRVVLTGLGKDKPETGHTHVEIKKRTWA